MLRTPRGEIRLQLYLIELPPRCYDGVDLRSARPLGHFVSSAASPEGSHTPRREQSDVALIRSRPWIRRGQPFLPRGKIRDRPDTLAAAARSSSPAHVHSAPVHPRAS